nr:uncharacterized protein LOC109178435 isoform X2 [Ipomoea trifida]
MLPTTPSMPSSSLAATTVSTLRSRYGELQGYNKPETAERYGKEQVHKWRRSYDVRPPNGESLEMCLGRAVTYFKEHIEPQLMAGKHVMVVAHANSLRSIIMYLDELTSEEVINLEQSTGVPMLYIYKDGKFIRRGSPPEFFLMKSSGYIELSVEMLKLDAALSMKSK